MTDQDNNPSTDVANIDSSTADVNAPRHIFKAPQIRTKHEGLLHPPMIAVYMNGIDDPFFFKIDMAMIFGRNTAPEPQPTLIDLGPSGLERGVSRQHARIRWQNGLLFIEDLQSSNGINQIRIAPYVPQRLSSGGWLN